MSYTLNTPFATKTLFLNSRNCVKREVDGVYKYFLKESISPQLNTDLVVSVVDVSIPNLINNITDYNNVIVFNIQYYGEFVLTIPIGIYNVYEFVDFINNNALHIGVTYNKYKLSFSSTYGIVSIMEGTTCGHLIGVKKNSQNKFMFPATTLGYINFSGTPYIFLLVKSISVTNLNSKGETDGTLIRIPVNCRIGDIIYYNPSNVISYLVSTNTISSIELTLQDHQNRNIDIGNLDFQIQIKIDNIYTPELQDQREGTIANTLKVQQETEKEMKTEDGLGI
jgi:hypothetical protein